MIFYKLNRRWLNYQEKRWAEEKEIVQKRDALKRFRKNRRLETSKLVLWFMLFLLLTIMIFTGYVTLYMMNIAASYGGGMDFTPLVTLISAIVGQVIVTLGYFAKASKENSKDGVVFETAMLKLQQQEEETGKEGVG